MKLVSPDPEIASKQSSAYMAGVIVSPTTYTLIPRCINLIANALATSPDLPRPIIKTLLALTSMSSIFSMFSLSISDDTPLILSTISSIASFKIIFSPVAKSIFLYFFLVYLPINIDLVI